MGWGKGAGHVLLELIEGHGFGSFEKDGVLWTPFIPWYDLDFLLRRCIDVDINNFFAFAILILFYFVYRNLMLASIRLIRGVLYKNGSCDVGADEDKLGRHSLVMVVHHLCGITPILDVRLEKVVRFFRRRRLCRRPRRRLISRCDGIRKEMRGGDGDADLLAVGRVVQLRKLQPDDFPVVRYVVETEMPGTPVLGDDVCFIVHERECFSRSDFSRKIFALETKTQAGGKVG